MHNPHDYSGTRNWARPLRKEDKEEFLRFTFLRLQVEEGRKGILC
jgi:hypothetical protein